MSKKSSTKQAEDRKFCMSLPNLCADKYLCCYYCMQFNKCSLTKCHDDGTTCDRTCDEETLKSILPQNHMSFGEPTKTKTKQREDEL